MKMEHLGLQQRILSIGKFWSISNAIHRALGNNITTPYPFDKTYYIHYHDYMELPVILNNTYYHYDYLLFQNQTGYLNVLFFAPCISMYFLFIRYQSLTFLYLLPYGITTLVP